MVSPGPTLILAADRGAVPYAATAALTLGVGVGQVDVRGVHGHGPHKGDRVRIVVWEFGEGASAARVERLCWAERATVVDIIALSGPVPSLWDRLTVAPVRICRRSDQT